MNVLAMLTTCLATLTLVGAQGCASPGKATTTLAPSAQFEGPKEVAFIGARSDVERSLEDSLRGRGFRIKRFASISRMTAPTAAGEVESYNKSATRYALEVDSDVMDRCFGGGFRFRSLRVDVIDTKQNEIVLSFKTKGYSEKCQPLSGTIFGDIAGRIAAAWTPLPSVP